MFPIQILTNLYREKHSMRLEPNSASSSASKIFKASFPHPLLAKAMDFAKSLAFGVIFRFLPPLFLAFPEILVNAAVWLFPDTVRYRAGVWNAPASGHRLIVSPLG